MGTLVLFGGLHLGESYVEGLAVFDVEVGLRHDVSDKLGGLSAIQLANPEYMSILVCVFLLLGRYPPCC